MRPTASSLLSLVPIMMLGAVTALHAQEPQPGARVRVEAPGYVAGDFVGMVLSRTADTIRVVGSEGAAQISIPLARIRSLEISRGKSRSAGARAGMKWGIPISLAFGLVTAPTATACTTTSFNETVTDCRPLNAGEKVAVVGLFALSGAAWGAGIGALIGRERWEPLELQHIGVTALPNGRPGIGVTLTF